MGVKSDLVKLLFRVPQGSVLEPLHFTIYTSCFGKLHDLGGHDLGVIYHLYAEISPLKCLNVKML